MELNKIYNMDCLEGMKDINDKSINLIVIDPPYNIGKDKRWDKWKTVSAYVEWMGKVFIECQRVLKDNGSFYFFHNDFLQIVELQNWLNQNSKFVFKQLIVWNKKYKGVSNEGFLQGFIEPEGLRNYQKMVEYCLFYDKGNIFSEIIKTRMKELGLKEMVFRRLKLSKNGQPTGWCSNILNGKSIPVRDEWELVCKLIGQYDYDEINRTFNNQKTHHSVWNYEIAQKQGHVTPKPIELIENIIKHSSNEEDIILDCFIGSGTTAIAALNTGRFFIGFELNKGYYDIAIKRIEGKDYKG